MVVQYKQDKRCFPYTNWFVGNFEYRGRYYEFEALCYAQCSEYAINKGHVVTLFVSSIDKHEKVLSYDAGHQLGDKNMYNRGMIKELVEKLSSYVTAVPMKK